MSTLTEPRRDSSRSRSTESGGPAPLPRGALALTCLLGLLGLAVSGLGLLLVGAAHPVTVPTIHGGTAELFGGGLYRYDSLFQVANNRSTDLVMLLLGVPLLVFSLVWSMRGSWRGRLLLLGVTGLFLYVGASYALGAVAYNFLFLLYVALFSVGLFAFIWNFDSLRYLPAGWDRAVPRRWPGIFMLVSGVATLVIWMMDPISGLTQGGPPSVLGPYTTLFTHAFDIAVIVPSSIAAGVMILKGRGLGYVTAMSLLVLKTMLLPVITLGTIFQIQLGISFSGSEIAGPIAGFAVLAAGATAVIVAVLGRIPDRVDLEAEDAR